LLRKVLRISLIVAMISFCFSVINISQHTETARAAENDNVGSISVTGRGEITVKPDVAYVQVGLQTTGATAKESHEANAKQFAEISKALKDLKIADKDVKTTRFSTYPNYEWINNKNELKGFITEQIIQITYRDIDQIGTLLDKLADAGANRVESIQYSSEKLEEYQLSAIDKAIDQARVKADRMASRIGVKIKGVASISENGVNSNPIYFNPSMISAKEMAFDSASSTQVYPGELKIEATVTVVYSY